MTKITRGIFVTCWLLVNSASAQWNFDDNAGLCLDGTGTHELDIEICGRAIRLASAAGASDASAATLYSMRGRAYSAIGEYDRAIADFDAALQLNSLSATAHNHRGVAHHGKGDFKLALVDYQRAIELFPNYAEAYRNRGTSHFFNGDPTLAASDFTAAIELSPWDPAAVVFRGLARYQRGSFAEAAADFARAERMRFPYPYLALWSYLAGTRAAADVGSVLSDAASRLDRGEWPRPLITAYLGTRAPESALAAARDSPAPVRARRVSEASFYLGELALLRGKRERARALFGATVAGGVMQPVEHLMAAMALRRMGEPGRAN